MPSPLEVLARRNLTCLSARRGRVNRWVTSAYFFIRKLKKTIKIISIILNSLSVVHSWYHKKYFLPLTNNTHQSTRNCHYKLESSRHMYVFNCNKPSLMYFQLSILMGTMSDNFLSFFRFSGGKYGREFVTWQRIKWILSTRDPCWNWNYISKLACSPST